MLMRICCVILVISLAGYLSELAAADPPLPADITVVHDIPYREGKSGQWKLDLAMKKGTGACPGPRS